MESLRVDQWLWAARVFNTRRVAADACDGGKVHINDQAAKPAKAVRPGDLIYVSLPQGRRRVLKVIGLDERRGGAAHARLLYDDLTPPEPPRPRWAAPPLRTPGTGRPTKRERRALDRLRGF